MRPGPGSPGASVTSPSCAGAVPHRRQRADENPALEVAIAEADARQLPVVVTQDLTWRARWATDRRFRFVLGGSQAWRATSRPGASRTSSASSAGRPTPRERLLDLARRADLVVTEEFPARGLLAAAGAPQADLEGGYGTEHEDPIALGVEALEGGRLGVERVPRTTTRSRVSLTGSSSSREKLVPDADGLVGRHGPPVASEERG